MDEPLPWRRNRAREALARGSSLLKKATKAAARYGPAQREMKMGNEKRCLDCRFYHHPFLDDGVDPQAPGSCEKVAGTIDKDAVCRFWSGNGGT